MSEVLYMVVTKDKYELPLAVARSAAELSRCSACKASTPKGVSSMLSKGISGYVKVIIDDDLEESYVGCNPGAN